MPARLRAVALSAVLAAAAVAGTAAATAPSRPAPFACSGQPGTHRLDLTVSGQHTYGFYALPKGQPKGLVVFAHGHGHIAEDWQDHLMRTAARDGVIAVAMNYHGEDVAHRYGWRVAEGAQDSVAAAQYVLARCPRIATTVMYGVSMGGNTAGLAAAIPAHRAGGRPLFDYLFLVEPVTNVTETYHEAEAVHAALPTNATAAKAIQEIEQEMGGTFAQRPQVYLAHSDVTRAGDIKAAGVKGVVLVHDVDDGQAGYNQTREMAGVLARQGIPADVFTTVTRQQGNTDDDTWLDGYATGSIPGYDDPFVGHGSETSTTQLNITTGFDRLAALFAQHATPHCRQFVVDGRTGTTTPAVTAPGVC